MLKMTSGRRQAGIGGHRETKNLDCCCTMSVWLLNHHSNLFKTVQFQDYSVILHCCDQL